MKKRKAIYFTKSMIENSSTFFPFCHQRSMEENNNNANIEKIKDIPHRKIMTDINRWLAHIWQCENCPKAFKSYKELLMHKWDYHSH